ncbi:MAG TPA: hypothetical protein VFQ53_26010 [Kofleriaceae bacterium]|nr:hypothetical protein [Kofleriaceae bacterium]
MRIAWLILVALATGCVSDDIPKSSFGAIEGTPTVHYARATSGLTNYAGVGYYKFTIELATTDGCAGDTVASIEINTALTGPNQFPTGAIPIRTTPTPETVPSAYVTFQGATGTAGTIMIDSVAGTRIDGSANVTMTTGAMAASWIAYVCDTST